MYVKHVQIDTVYIVWDYVLHFSTVCIFFSCFIFYLWKIFNTNWILLKNDFMKKKYADSVFKYWYFILFFQKKVSIFYLRKIFQDYSILLKNDLIKNHANQVLLGSNIRLRLTNYSRKMSFTEGHIFFYFTLSGEPLVLQLNKSILKYMCRVEDLSNEQGFCTKYWCQRKAR